VEQSQREHVQLADLASFAVVQTSDEVVDMVLAWEMALNMA